MSPSAEVISASRTNLYTQRNYSGETGKRMILCCSLLSEFQTEHGMGWTSRLSSTYQRRTYRIVRSGRGVSVEFGEPRCRAHG